ncbi:MAG: deoxyribose-phosphate aldolase [Paludibacteraceae bacterium]|nr:deoxyribose-phosphate aldolase [Paludibacteraceae bacterium]
MDRLTAVLQKYDYSLKLDDISKRVDDILDKHMAANMQSSVYSKLISFVDLTSLKTDDNEDTISALVDKVNAFDDKFEILPHPAAICVYPSFVGLVRSTLTEDVEIAAVAGGFPHSQTMIEVKVAEVSLAVAEGATEIDVVIPVGKVMKRQYDEILEELSEIKSACRDAHLKVILETSLIRDPELIKEAAVVAMVAGADFIKTSTGKDSQCASLEAVYTMCEAVSEFNKLNNTKVGIKVAGGVSTTSDAVKYYTLVEQMLGEEWLTPELFRIGASRLVNNLLTSISGKDVKYF